jgi:hypothetical protein
VQEHEVQLGVRVEIRDDDGGKLTGVVTTVNGAGAVITPEEPAMQAWFPNGYVMGRAHWPAKLRKL